MATALSISGFGRREMLGLHAGWARDGSVCQHINEIAYRSNAKAAAGELRGILGYEQRALLSIDHKDGPHLSIFDAPSTMVIDCTQVKLLACYDHEWRYVTRMINLTQKGVQGL